MIIILVEGLILKTIASGLKDSYHALSPEVGKPILHGALTGTAIGGSIKLKDLHDNYLYNHRYELSQKDYKKQFEKHLYDSK